MTIESTQCMRDRAEVFMALGHPARLSMLVALGDGERSVSELREVVGLDLSTVSRHLTVLRTVGLVEAGKRGRQVFYSLKLPCALKFVECVDRALKERGISSQC